MKISELDDYHLSASALNPFAKCESKWLENYALQSPKLAPIYPGYFILGSRVHDIEQRFWSGMLLHGKKIMSRISDASFQEVFDMFNIYKMMLIGSHEENVARYASNLAWVDAKRFIELRKHFDGNFDQAWKYLMPIGVEFEQYNHDTKTHIKLDRLMLIPARFKNYRNQKDALGILDFKPGKMLDNGYPRHLNSNRDYDASFGGDFNRQLAFYLDNVEYPLANLENGIVPIQEKFAIGMYYKTRQLLVDKFDGRTFAPLKKLVARFWETEEFERCDLFNWEGKRKYTFYDECSKCEYRLTCRPSLSLWQGNGRTRYLKDCVKTVECKTCKKKFVIFKHKDNLYCNTCLNVQKVKKC